MNQSIEIALVIWHGNLITNNKRGGCMLNNINIGDIIKVQRYRESQSNGFIKKCPVSKKVIDVKDGEFAVMHGKIKMWQEIKNFIEHDEYNLITNNKGAENDYKS